MIAVSSTKVFDTGIDDEGDGRSGRANVGSVSVCWGCHDTVPQTGQLKQHIYFLTVLEAGSPRTRCPQGWCLERPPFLSDM